LHKQTQAQTKNHIFNVSAFILVFASTVFWSSLYLNIHMDTDTGWLIQCLERFISGGLYATDFYETNPPLSFLIYLPGYSLHALDLINAKTSVLITFFFYMAIANLLALNLLKQLKLGHIETLAFLSFLILAQTWASNIAFGLKDHLIFIFVVPYCIYQIGLASAIEIKKRDTILTAILMAFALCLKPHYAILPVLFLIYRLITKTSVRRTLLATDFIIIELCILAFATYLFICFPNFIYKILPDLQNIYISEERFNVMDKAIFLALPILSLIAIYYVPDNKDNILIMRRLVVSFSIFSFILFISFAIQGKGFEYQAIPFLGTTISIFLFSLFYVVQHYIRLPSISLAVIFLISIGLLYKINIGKDKTLLTPEEFANIPYHQKLQEYAWNNIYASYEFFPLNLALPYHTDLKYGSRFGQVWPISGLSQKLETQRLSTNEVKETKEKMQSYISMFAKDIEKYKPSVISIPQYYDPEKDGPSRKYIDFLLANPDFKLKMEDYDFVETVKFDKSQIVTAIKNEEDKYLSFDLYQRKKD